MVRYLEEWRENLDKNYIVGGVLMDLSKASDCVPHDFTNLLNWKQCVRINNIKSNFTNVISGVLQGSTVGPILFVSLMTFLCY